MDLDGWQSRFESHFDSLRKRRSSLLGDSPVFALEHGLAEEEREQIADAVRAEARPPSWKHRLPWVVYAAEVGYRYSGDEYWQTFEVETPGWGLPERPFIRHCFRDFRDRYGGAEPRGRWARHFSIICWPITHAILPKDLQQQLARILFQTRLLIRSRDLSSPVELGRLIAARSANCSSRFRNLAEEPLLLGQISAALLLEDEDAAGLLVLPSTLSRISADLDHERRARSWMKGARDSVRDRLQVRGGVESPKDPSKTTKREPAPRSPTLSLKPRLLLRRSSPEAEWTVVLEIPDFSGVIETFPDVRETLTSARCRVSGFDGSPRPRGWLLYGPQQLRLDHWPSEEEPLIAFEASDRTLEFLLENHFLLPPGPRWLFKLGRDGVARELSAQRVRPGSQYVLVTRSDSSVLRRSPFERVAIRCDGVEAHFLDLPRALSPAIDQALDALELATATSIEIRPIGLPPARWDGEGHLEWLSTDRPLLAIQADHVVGTYRLNCGDQAVEGAPPEPGAPVVFELSDLEEGLHRLSVVALDTSSNAKHDPVDVEVSIRDPYVWKAGAHQQSAFLVVTEPYDPCLEDVWEGRLTLDAHGPRRHRVDVRVSLFEKGATRPHFSEKFGSLKLPVTTDEWSETFQRFVKKNRQVQNAYESASYAVVHIDAQELGLFSMEVEREFTPLRWRLHRTRDAYYLRAVDDSGSEARPRVFSFSFDKPDTRSELDLRPFLVGHGAEAEPGLFVLEADGSRRGFVIPPKVRTMEDLKWNPIIQSRRRTPNSILRLLETSALWSEARVPGQVLAAERRRRIVETFTRELCTLIGGVQWGTIERRIAEELNDRAIADAKEAVTDRKHEMGLVAVLHRDLEEYFEMPTPDRVPRFAELAEQFLDLRDSIRLGVREIPNSEKESVALWLSELALRLASAPEPAARWISDHPRAAVSCLLEVPTLVRAARFLVLAMRKHAPPLSLGAQSSNPGWRWV